MLSVGDAIPVGAERAAGGHNRSSVREGVDIAEKVPDVWIVRESRFVDYAERLEASGLGRVTSAAPFFRTDVGTDRYTDELW